MTKKVHTHYDNLKVARNAPIEVIRAAYRSLSQKYHPDRNPNDPESTRIMTLINTSYEVLSDPQKRAEHDDWIRRQEGQGQAAEARSQQKPSEPEIEFPPPASGQCNYWDLPEPVRKRIDARVAGQEKEQLAISMNDTGMKYAGLFILPWWFAYLVYSAMDSRWSEDSVSWLMGISFFSALGTAYSAAWLWEWKKSPVKKWLIVTPLYLIQTNLDRVQYWPIWTISDIKATHNYRNGSYQNTSVSLTLDKVPHHFTLPQEGLYKTLVDTLRLFDGKFRAAISGGDDDYLISKDDFLLHRLAGSVKGKRPAESHIKYKIYGGIAAACGVVWLISSSLNSSAPEVRPVAGKPYMAEPKIAAPRYTRPATAPNGEMWPTSSGYVRGYEKLHTDGLSTVTIDNSRNDNDVFVKLVSIDSAEDYPVRQFFVSAYGEFTINKVRAGTYDVRYKDLDSGSISKSEPFELREEESYDGVRYSNITMTLYKIQNGNMQTTSIPESQF